uniref:CUE domain-containing protein n=1 Tax=Chenopodium quinoa TaxID=63459 RepID=A0A803N1F7_CHEQI
MSNRSSNHRYENPNFSVNRGFRGKTQKQFVPQTNHNSATSTPQTSNPSFSASVRQSQSSNSASSAPHFKGSRVQLGANGEWVSSSNNGGGGNFVNYLPQDEAVAVGLGAEEGGLDPLESQRVVDLLNRELARLLKLKPRDFWREVAVDASLHEFLDSFLQFISRWYDFPYHGAKGIVAGVIVGDLELSRRVFMLLYRISSNKDPGLRVTESLSPKDHQVLLQEKKLLNLPKLLDICAVYGHENEDLTRSLVLNAINAQSDTYRSFTTMLSHFLGIVRTMCERCSSSLEVLISAGGCVYNGPSQQHIEYLEVMDFLNDAVVSMDTFVSAYKPAALYLSCPVDASHCNEELINVLATLHDSLLPLLQQGLQIILAAGKETSPMLSDVSLSLKMLSSRLVGLGWKLLDNCYLSEEFFKDNLPFPAAMKMFPASVEDPVIRADILVQTFKEIAAVPQGKHHRGWVFIDDEQYQYLTAMMTHPLPAVSRKLPSAPNSDRSDGLQVAEDAAITESKISQVKDLFPDYGKGFISACLEAYDHNPEEVIQRILEGTLHEDLRKLDTKIMEIIPTKSAPQLTKKDKGKGIFVESTEPPTTNSIIKPQKPNHEAVSSSGSSISSSVGRFIRKSKDDQPDHATLGSRDEKHMEKTTALLSQYEYEDEYDDSFDDLGMTVMESGVEETEILGEKIRSKLSVSSGAESHGSGSSTATSKWSSKKKPQFYVKDGKNYSYKVEGSVAVADQKQASLINQAQKEQIHGLGRGGNRPLGAVKILVEQNQVEVEESDPSEMDGGGNAGRGRGRGCGRRGGGRNNHYRKDRAMKKHITGLGGF